MIVSGGQGLNLIACEGLRVKFMDVYKEIFFQNFN